MPRNYVRKTPRSERKFSFSFAITLQTYERLKERSYLLRITTSELVRHMVEEGLAKRDEEQAKKDKELSLSTMTMNGAPEVENE